MANLGLAAYQSRRPVSLATFFNAANTSQNAERLGLAREQLDAQKEAAERELALKDRRAQGLAAYFGGGPAPATGAALEASPANRGMERYAPLAAAGYGLDEIKAIADLESAGRTDQIEIITGMAEMTAQAAQMIEALPEEQRETAWMDATKRIERAFGQDIPDEFQVYSPENLAAMKAQALPVLDLFKTQNRAPSAAIQGYEKAVEEGFAGSFMDYQTSLRRAGATNVRVGPDAAPDFDEYARRKRVEELAKAQGANEVRRGDDISERADQAGEQLDLLYVMRDILPKVRSGFGGETALEVQSALERIGVEIDLSGVTSEAELFRQLSNKMTLLSRPVGSGEMSNSDRDFFQDSVANLSTTPGGNALAIEYGIKRAERAQALEGLYQDWLERRALGDESRSWAETRNAYNKANPLFTPEDRARAKAALERGKVDSGVEVQNRFSSMSPDNLRAFDPDTLDTVEELNAYTEAMRKMRNGG